MSVYRVPVLGQFAWQEPVLDRVLAPTITARGTRYLVADVGATGVFAGQEGKIAWMDATDDVSWSFDSASTGWQVYDVAGDEFLVYDGSVWSSASTMDGLELTGDVSNTVPIDWNLDDDEAESLTFKTLTDVDMLNFNTTDGAEAVEIGEIANPVDLKLTGAMDLTDASVNVELSDNTDSLTFSKDTTSILTIDSTNLGVKVDRDLTVVGDLVVQGTTTTIETANLVVEDSLITLNKGGGATSANDSGIEFEEDSVITGYIKTAANRDDFILNAPANDNVLTIDIDADTTLNMVGDLIVETEGGTINQDLTTDATTVQFGALEVNGDIDLSTDGGVITVTDNDPNAFNINSGAFNVDTSTGAIEISTSGGLEVGGVTTLLGDIDLTGGAIDVDLVDDISALSFDSTLAGILSIDSRAGVESVDFGRNITVANDAVIEGDINVSATTKFTTDGTDGVTVAEAEMAYTSRGQWDTALNVLRFDVTDEYVPA